MGRKSVGLREKAGIRHVFSTSTRGISLECSSLLFSRCAVSKHKSREDRRPRGQS